MLLETPILIILILFCFYDFPDSGILYQIAVIMTDPGAYIYGFFIVFIRMETYNTLLFISNAIFYYFTILLIMKLLAYEKKQKRSVNNL
jgi:hypothetical protein